MDTSGVLSCLAEAMGQGDNLISSHQAGRLQEARQEWLEGEASVTTECSQRGCLGLAMMSGLGLAFL